MDGGGALPAILLPAVITAEAPVNEVAPNGKTSSTSTLLAAVSHLAAITNADADSQATSPADYKTPTVNDVQQTAGNVATGDSDTAGVRPVAPVIPKGWDGTTPPMPGWRWVGSGPVGSNEGAWVPPEGSPRETIHPDTTPHDIGDHVDWRDIYNNKWKWVEETGKWHPAEGNKKNRPQPIFPEGTLAPSDDGPSQAPDNKPGGTTAPTQQQPLIPFWPWPALPKPTPVPIPVPAFGIPIFIIPVWPKPETLFPGYEGPPMA